MKKAFTKVLSIILSLTVIITGLPLIGVNLSSTANAKTLSEYVVGDIIEFGSYPQSEVTDEALLQELNSLTLNWVSYEYYTGTGNWRDGQMKPSDYMKYADVTYNEFKYRAVTFTGYRPYLTGYKSLANNSYQDDNGYYINSIYWFKYEPLQWRVLDPNEGLIMCESIIDSQPFNNILYYDSTYSLYYSDLDSYINANWYSSSSIREWLNNDLFNVAFSNTEQSEILRKNNNNVFLLSYDDAINSQYGFSSNEYDYGYDSARCAQGTDYAKSQGLYTEDENYSYWRLSTDAPYDSFISFSVSCSGMVDAGHGGASDTAEGIRPAVYLDPSYVSEENSLSIEQMTSQIRFDRNADNSYAGTFDVRTRANVSDEDFTTLVGATNEDAINNIKKVGFVYSINPDAFSPEDAKTVAMGGEVSGYTDAPVKHIQDADGYYMFTCLVTDIPSTDTNYTLVSYAYICVEDADGNENWYFMETQAEADFNSLYATYYPIACEKYGW